MNKKFFILHHMHLDVMYPQTLGLLLDSLILLVAYLHDGYDKKDKKEKIRKS